jgi:hypothetical protein
MAHRSFAAALAELDHEPITFDLGEDATFSVPRPIPGVAMGKLAAQEGASDAQAFIAFMDFFEIVMTPDEFARFETIANERRVPLEMVVEIAHYVIEEGVGRPTEQPSDSQGKSSTISHLSPVAASNEE